MCVPPHCTPARRCLGCLSLRQGACLIVIGNAIYGLMLVVVHVFILTERSRIQSSVAPPVGQPTAQPVSTARHGDNWYLQIVDLDMAWAHGCLGIGDFMLCMFGLVYGIVVMSFSAFVLHAALTSPRSAAVICRWFMMFLHIELILYIALVIVKLPLLCDIKNKSLPLLGEDCHVLRFMFFERAVSRTIIGSLCCWLFSSFSYYLAWGDPVIEDAALPDGVSVLNPPVASDMDQQQRLQAFREGRIPTSVSPTTRVFPTEYAVERGSFRTHVGDPVSVSSKYEPRFVDATRSSFHGGGNINGHGGSFVATSGRYAGGSSYIMPRASSSIQSQQSEMSNGFAERQMLIKPPIIIH